MSRSDVLVYLDGDTVLAPGVIAGILDTWKQFASAPGESFSLMLPTMDVGREHGKCEYDRIMQEIRDEEKHRIEKEAEKEERQKEREQAASRRAGEGISVIRPYGGGRIGLRSWIRQDVKHMEKQGDIRWDEVKSRCWAVSREDVLKAGNWDAGFVGYGEEDVDLAYRLYQKCKTKFRVLYHRGLGAAHMKHPVRFRKRDRQWVRNGALLISKHPGIKKERLAFFARMGLSKLMEKELTNI